MRIHALALAALLSTGCANALERARSARLEGDLAKAETLYRKSVEREPSNREAAGREVADLLTDRANASKDTGTAEQLLEEALRFAPDSEEARVALARLLVRQDDRAAAMAMLEYEGCKACGRLKAVLLLESADAKAAAEDWAGAREDYQYATEVLQDPNAALGVVRSYAEQNNPDDAIAAMAVAAPLIGGSDTRAQQTFLQLRANLVRAAAIEGELTTVDRYMALTPPGGGGDPWFALQLLVARERFLRDDASTALARLRRLVSQNPDMPAQRLGETRELMVEIHNHLASLSLRRGDVEGVKEDAKRALEIDPDSERARLLLVLSTADADLPGAMKRLEDLPGSSAGKKEVRGILLSIQAHEHIQARRLDAARDVIAQAQQVAPDVPEVHLASAELLARTEVDGLTRGQKKTLRDKGLVKYPRNKILRLGEALSELDWTRQRMESLGSRFPFRAASTGKRIESLDKSIREAYPLDVEFEAEQRTVLVLESQSGSDISVRIKGAGVSTKLTVGSQPLELTVKRRGLLEITTDGSAFALVAEPYTRVSLVL